MTTFITVMWDIEGDTTKITVPPHDKPIIIKLPTNVAHLVTFEEVDDELETLVP